MAVLTVGEGKQYATIAAAVAATGDGDTVLVDAGTYTNDFFTNYHQITLQSVGGMAILKATEAPPNGKAIVTTDASITIDGFGFTGASVSDLNGAGIRYEWGDMVVRNCLFWDNQDGILAAALGPGHILIQNSEFSHNGAGDGYSHNIYVNGIESLVIEDSYFHDSVVGHEIKSRAHNTTLLNNRIQDNAGDGSYSIDLPNGGNALIQGNVIEKGANAQNYHSIHFGGEGPPYDGSNLTIDGNTLINDHAQGRLVLNHAGSPVTLSNNQIWGYAADNIAVGPVTQQGNTILASRPALDLTTMAPPAPPPPTEPPQFTVPTVAHLQSWGAGGAVVASGHVLRVGAGQAFTTLSQALTASQDGDTIQVAAGTYVNDFGTVNHKVIIEGVGGLARFVQQGVVWAPNGMLVVNTDATLRNLEFTGATNYSGHEGGIYVTGGNVTVDNSYFHHNDIGIRTADNAGATLSIFGTEAAWNGNVNKGTHNLAIGAIQSLTIQGSYIHGAITGHELSTRSFYTDIEGNRIIDGDGVAASFLINLAQGGDATIRDNVLEKGRDAANGILIHVGNEGPTYDNSDVRITGNTLVSDLANQWHPYTYFIVGDNAGSLLAPITASGNTFVGGVPGSAQVVNGAASGNATAANAVLYTNAPWSAAQAPAEFAAAAPAGLNTLTVRLAEAASVLDAQFVVSVDGAAVGGGVVTASQAAGGSQAFSFNGWWSTGAHAVTVSFINPQRDYAGADGLYVQSVSLDGATTTAAAGLDYWSRSYTTTLTGSSPLPDFDPAYYLAQNPDVAASGMDPLRHYLSVGWTEGRDPSALFSTRYYLSHNPDVAAAGVNPLLHYEQTGWTEGRDPSALFSVREYLGANPDVAAANIDPLRHYIQFGQAEHRAIEAAAAPSEPDDPLVDSAYYYAAHPEIAAAGISASASYHADGWTKGYNPNAFFDTNYYLAHNPDVAAAGVDPLRHFDATGWKEGRDPGPGLSLNAYRMAHPAEYAQGIDPLIVAMRGAAGLPAMSYPGAEGSLFDGAYYLSRYQDVAAAQADPLAHYQAHGWRENRDPSASFSTEKYLDAYADVKAAGIDPLAHYATYGVGEGRLSFSA